MLSVEVINDVFVDVATSSMSGIGAGLTGLRERVELDGGVLEHGRIDGVFRLAAELPWAR